jgi:hypothetical protein
VFPQERRSPELQSYRLPAPFENDGDNRVAVN